MGEVYRARDALHPPAPRMIPRLIPTEPQVLSAGEARPSILAVASISSENDSFGKGAMRWMTLAWSTPAIPRTFTADSSSPKSWRRRRWTRFCVASGKRKDEEASNWVSRPVDARGHPRGLKHRGGLIRAFWLGIAMPCPQHGGGLQTPLMKTNGMWDAIVVGAGPAGCAAAYDLATARSGVLLLDRRSFPRTKACAGALTIKTLRALRYSVEPIVRKVCTNLVVGKGLGRTTLFRGEAPISMMTVRSEFDAYCLKKTIEAGAVFRVVSTIRAIAQSDTHVSLITDKGSLNTRFLVGADGANSRVRTLTSTFPGAALGFAMETCLPQPEGRSFEMEFDFGYVPSGYAWIFPKNDHLNVGVYTNSNCVKLNRQMLDLYARKKCGMAIDGSVVGHHIGFGGWCYVPNSRRILLIGDAAGLAEPLLGEGIYFAIRSGQIAAQSIEAELFHRGVAQRAFTESLRKLQSDLRCSHKSASKFYGDPERGYRALTFPLTRYSLMKGFAMGLPFRAIKRTFWSFAFRSVPSSHYHCAR